MPKSKWNSNPNTFEAAAPDTTDQSCTPPSVKQKDPVDVEEWIESVAAAWLSSAFLSDKREG